MSGDENKAWRIVIAGGGTGGHVFPALALADQLHALYPRSAIFFVGSKDGLEAKLVAPSGYPLTLLKVGKLRGKGWLVRARTLSGLPFAVAEAYAFLREHQPHVVVGVGGYASAPVVMAATLLRQPVVLLEQNSIPGTVNRFLARFAKKIVVAYRLALKHLPKERAVLLGNPLRRDIVEALAARPNISRQETGRPLCLLVLGGSQGAHGLNEAMTKAAVPLLKSIPDLHIIHQTGAADSEWVKKRYEAEGIEAEVKPFIEEMADVYCQADLVLSRSGATTLAELCISGLPAILVPYPFAIDDHQAHNAAEVAERGGAIVIAQKDLDEQKLAQNIAELIIDESRLKQMGEAMTQCAFPDAASQIAQLIVQIAAQKTIS